MEYFEVGKKYPQFVGKQESVYFDITDAGSVLYLLFDRPTNKEIEQISADHPLRMSMVEKRTFIMPLFKFGDLNWIDSTYTPHLSRNLHTPIEMPDKGKGLAVSVMLIDTHSGELKHLRLISMPEELTRKIFSAVNKLAEEPFDSMAYTQEINATFQRWTTDQLVKMAERTYQI